VSKSLLADAFAHNAWATLQLIDACLSLEPEELEASAPGTYGSILATLRHLVDSDCWDLCVASGDRSVLIDGQGASLPELRAAMERNGPAWAQLLEAGIDAETMLREVDDHDGFERRAPLGVQLAQALHHGSDHRSQVCSALSALGVKPPAVDVWSYGVQAGLVTETYPRT
jgi:uncharacterized damage-inducible protein DinB